MTLEDEWPLEPPCTQAQEVSQADVGDCHTPLEPKRSVELTLEAQHTVTDLFCVMTYMRQLAYIEVFSRVDVATLVEIHSYVMLGQD